nr:hypothetical protein [Mesorhizobium ventifaucium]
MEHDNRRFPLGLANGVRQRCIARQPVAVVHQHTANEAQQLGWPSEPQFIAQLPDRTQRMSKGMRFSKGTWLKRLSDPSRRPRIASPAMHACLPVVVGDGIIRLNERAADAGSF